MNILGGQGPAILLEQLDQITGGAVEDVSVRFNRSNVRATGLGDAIIVRVEAGISFNYSTVNSGVGFREPNGFGFETFDGNTISIENGGRARCLSSIRLDLPLNSDCTDPN